MQAFREGKYSAQTPLPWSNHEGCQKGSRRRFCDPRGWLDGHGRHEWPHEQTAERNFPSQLPLLHLPAAILESPETPHSCRRLQTLIRRSWKTTNNCCQSALTSEYKSKSLPALNSHAVQQIPSRCFQNILPSTTAVLGCTIDLSKTVSKLTVLHQC